MYVMPETVELGRYIWWRITGCHSRSKILEIHIIMIKNKRLRMFSLNDFIWSLCSITRGVYISRGTWMTSCAFCDATLHDLNSCWISKSPAWGRQVRPATEPNCVSEISDIHLTDSLFLHDSGYFLQDWPTNGHCMKPKSFLTSTSEVNKSHYPPLMNLNQ